MGPAAYEDESGKGVHLAFSRPDGPLGPRVHYLWHNGGLLLATTCLGVSRLNEPPISQGRVKTGSKGVHQARVRQ